MPLLHNGFPAGFMYTRHSERAPRKMECQLQKSNSARQSSGVDTPFLSDSNRDTCATGIQERLAVIAEYAGRTALATGTAASIGRVVDGLINNPALYPQMSTADQVAVIIPT